ncbi:MAG: hypothetical protein M1837_001078 [Sclerophora amabilis]|nr:MAG: hypothetical protein M1837_001078 [Sclerophora amabilis]
MPVHFTLVAKLIAVRDSGQGNRRRLATVEFKERPITRQLELLYYEGDFIDRPRPDFYYLILGEVILAEDQAPKFTMLVLSYLAWPTNTPTPAEYVFMQGVISMCEPAKKLDGGPPETYHFDGTIEGYDAVTHQKTHYDLTFLFDAVGPHYKMLTYLQGAQADKLLDITFRYDFESVNDRDYGRCVRINFTPYQLAGSPALNRTGTANSASALASSTAQPILGKKKRQGDGPVTPSPSAWRS